MVSSKESFYFCDSLFLRDILSNWLCQELQVSEIVPYLQDSKLVCHSFEAGKKHKISGSETGHFSPYRNDRFL